MNARPYYGQNKLVEAVFGKNSRLTLIQIILLVVGIYVAYKGIVFFANYQPHTEEAQ